MKSAAGQTWSVPSLQMVPTLRMPLLPWFTLPVQLKDPYITRSTDELMNLRLVALARKYINRSGLC